MVNHRSKINSVDELSPLVNQSYYIRMIHLCCIVDFSLDVTSHSTYIAFAIVAQMYALFAKKKRLDVLIT